ncbi:DUF1549 and DUF1553 domain-containing protein [Prosthecobacter sp.]|uniref:DUF1549 and DUF1553 domain-containing protein n=1 Tax=Prosthecobacter sp. TaxID=1965333 RepID=UPI003783DFF3
MQAADTKAAKTWEQEFAARKGWWALQPETDSKPPVVRDEAWSHSAVDRFLRARMEAVNVVPAAMAEPRVLIRRATLVLTGLPPTPEEVNAFVTAWSRDARGAYEALVDRLLASPHFGERFARHWMDVVRFSETNGSEFNYDVPFAWRYRDYVIRAFNGDVPYDHLVREHIAGDLLPQPRRNPADDLNESAIGTAFYRFGEVSQQSCVEFRIVGFDIADNQLDTLTKTFQASTVACARCHDHKLDAILTKDYYALLGVLRSSRAVQRTLDGPAANRAPMERLRALKQQLRTALAAVWREEASAINAESFAKLSSAAPPPVGDPLHAWHALSKVPAQGIAETWSKLAAEQAGASAAAAEFNRKNFTTLADFRSGFNGWTTDGMGLRDGTGRSGDFAVACEGGSAVKAVLPAGAFTFALSDKLNGALRSPPLKRTQGNVSFEVVGGHNSLARLVFNNCQLSAHQKSLHHQDWTWLTVPFPGGTDDLHPYAELMTFWDNPKFPEPQGDGTDKDSGVQRGTWSEHAKNPRTWWGVRRIVMHNVGEPPKDELTRLAHLFEGAPPASMDAAAARYAQIAQQAVAAFAADQAGDDEVAWLEWLIKRGLLSNRADASPKVARLIGEYRAVEGRDLSLPHMMPGVADEGAGFEQALLARGDIMKPGAPVAHGYLEALSSPAFTSKGSGRRELADLIASADNPLTARVMVNRIWQWIFGVGLVRTPDDFGHLGEQPSHPQLLDHQARRFVAEGWSVKKLVRALVLSRAFQSAAVPTPSASERDPQNTLLSHFSARRAEAEVIRDAMLAASGRLDATLFGPSIDPYREQPDRQSRLFAGPLDGNGRRSIYIKFQLLEAARFLSAFNLPGGKVAEGRRDSSNVPAQSLALLNDPFVIAMAEAWAGRLVKDGGTSIDTRVEAMFQTALNRPPSPAERARVGTAIKSFASQHQVAPEGLLASRAVWKDAAHAFFNFNEFIFIP